MWFSYRAVSAHPDPEDDVDVREKLFGEDTATATSRKGFWSSYSSRRSPSGTSVQPSASFSQSSTSTKQATASTLPATAPQTSPAPSSPPTQRATTPSNDDSSGAKRGTGSTTIGTTSTTGRQAVQDDSAIGSLITFDDEQPSSGLFQRSLPSAPLLAEGSLPSDFDWGPSPSRERRSPHRDQQNLLQDVHPSASTPDFDEFLLERVGGGAERSSPSAGCSSAHVTAERDMFQRCTSEPQGLGEMDSQRSKGGTSGTGGTTSRLRTVSHSANTHGPPEESSATTPEPEVLDFEVQDSVEHERRELLIYAVPLYRDEVVFLPVSTWRDAPKDPMQGVAGEAQKKLVDMKDHVVEKWDALKEQDPDTLGNKIWRAGQRIAENVSPTERLMRAIPKDVTRIKVFHPTQLGPDEVSERLRKMAADARLKNGAQATVAGLFLPVALTLDLLVIPGIHVLTAYTAWQLGKNASSTIGAQRMSTYVAEEGRGANRVRVDYVPDPRIDRYLDVVNDSVDGVLAEEEIVGLATDLQQDALVEPMMELRARQIRLTATKQNDYSLLPSK